MGRRLPARMTATYVWVLNKVEAGQSFAEIARTLNREGVPTSAGGLWWPSTVQAIVRSRAALELATPEPPQQEATRD